MNDSHMSVWWRILRYFMAAHTLGCVGFCLFVRDTLSLIKQSQTIRNYLDGSFSCWAYLISTKKSQNIHNNLDNIHIAYDVSTFHQK